MRCLIIRCCASASSFKKKCDACSPPSCFVFFHHSRQHKGEPRLVARASVQAPRPGKGAAAGAAGQWRARCCFERTAPSTGWATLSSAAPRKGPRTSVCPPITLRRRRVGVAGRRGLWRLAPALIIVGPRTPPPSPPASLPLVARWMTARRSRDSCGTRRRDPDRDLRA